MGVKAKLDGKAAKSVKRKVSKRNDSDRAANGGNLIGRIPKPVWMAITTATTAGVSLFMRWLHEKPDKKH